MRFAFWTLAILFLPVVTHAAICRHNGAYWPASSYSSCPECAIEGKIPPGYNWYNAHLAPSGSRNGHESGQEGWEADWKTYDATRSPMSHTRTTARPTGR